MYFKIIFIGRLMFTVKSKGPQGLKSPIANYKSQRVPQASNKHYNYKRLKQPILQSFDNFGCFFRDTGAPFSAQDGKIFLLFVSFICTCIETKSILCSYQRRPFFVKPFFLCTSSHTPSHSLGCGVNFHYTSLRYNDFNGLHLLSLLLLFSLSDMHFIGF